MLEEKLAVASHPYFNLAPALQLDPRFVWIRANCCLGCVWGTKWVLEWPGQAGLRNTAQTWMQLMNLVPNMSWHVNQWWRWLGGHLHRQHLLDPGGCRSNWVVALGMLRMLRQRLVKGNMKRTAHTVSKSHILMNFVLLILLLLTDLFDW